MQSRSCDAHVSGVPIDAPPFFSAGCKQCEAKKAAGKVTGNEGPLAHGWRRLRDQAKRIDWAVRRELEKANGRDVAPYNSYRGENR